MWTAFSFAGKTEDVLQDILPSVFSLVGYLLTPSVLLSPTLFMVSREVSRQGDLSFTLFYNI